MGDPCNKYFSQPTLPELVSLLSALIQSSLMDTPITCPLSAQWFQDQMGGLVPAEPPAPPGWASLASWRLPSYCLGARWGITSSRHAVGPSSCRQGYCICLYINLASCPAQSRAYMLECVNGFQRLEEPGVSGKDVQGTQG